MYASPIFIELNINTYMYTTKNTPKHKHTAVTELLHYSDVITSAMASKITCASLVCSSVCSGTDLRKHQSSASLAFVRGSHWSPVDSPHKGSVTQKRFPFDDVIRSRGWNSEGGRLVTTGTHSICTYLYSSVSSSGDIQNLPYITDTYLPNRQGNVACSSHWDALYYKRS